MTGAGAAAGLDMCLHLIRRAHGAALANALARILVTPPHRDGLPIDQVADRVGYRNAAVFREQFTARRGLPPRDYRRTFSRQAVPERSGAGTISAGPV